MKNWQLPIRIIILYLAVLGLFGTWSWARTDINIWAAALLNLSLLWSSGFLLYKGLLSQGLIKSTRWEHRVITSLILFLLFDPGTPWFVFLLMGILAELGQRFLRMATGPIFNPAALTTFIICLWGYFPVWAGVSFAPRLPVVEGGMSVAMLLTLPVAGYVAHKYKKLPIVLAAVLTFTPLYWLVFRTNPAFLLLEGTLAFFLLVMVVEPKTSPATLKEQAVFGMGVGLAVVIAQLTFALEPYVMSLLTVNGIFQFYRYSVMKRWVPKLV